MSAHEIKIAHKNFIQNKPRIIRQPTVPAVSMRQIPINKNRPNRANAPLVKIKPPEIPVIPAEPMGENPNAAWKQGAQINHGGHFLDQNVIEIWRNKTEETDRTVIVSAQNGIILMADAAAFLEGQSSETWAISEASFLANYSKEE